MADWLTDVLAGTPGSEREVVSLYTDRLLRLARRELPVRLRGRLDAEDVVQSVYRSFFRRLRGGQFTFDETHDVWRLLTVMTYHKVTNVIKHHDRGRRDVRRERTIAATESSPGLDPPAGERQPGPEDLAILYECLEQLVAGLPDKYRAIVTLRLEGYTIAEIARKVGYSQRTVLRVLGGVQDTAAAHLGHAS